MLNQKLICNVYTTEFGFQFHYPDTSLVFTYSYEDGQGMLYAFDRDEDATCVFGAPYDFKQTIIDHGVVWDEFIADFGGLGFSINDDFNNSHLNL